jgi:probable HAF family extracellular repeat protein
VKTIRIGLITSALLLTSIAVASPAQATTPRYTFTDLGTLGGGVNATSVANAINNAGVVVGTTTVASGAQHGFRWSAATGMVDLGVLPGGSNSVANAINDAGQVAGTADRENGGYGYPVRWSSTGAITDLGGTITNRLGVGNGIDPTGRVAGGQRAADSEGSPFAMLYDTSGGSINLGTPPDSLGAANGINARGQVVGSPGFLWQSGTVTMLPNLAGVTGSGVNATAINIRGQIVGTSSVGSTYNMHGVEWNGTAVTDIGTVDSIQYSSASAINAAGEVVGTADPLCSPCVLPRAWIWRPGGTIAALDTLLPSGSGWKLERAFGINDRGQIVGSGRLNGGLPHAFLLTPAYTVSINFQPAGSTVPTGYVPDAGGVYATQYGYTYGWHVDDTAWTRDRNSSLSWDQRYDTLIHSAHPDRTNYWELYVPNGTYVVHTVSGDPCCTDSTHVILAEGVVVASGTPTTSHLWIEGTITVTVTDNHLTITNGSTSTNDKLNYIDIHTA